MMFPSEKTTFRLIVAALVVGLLYRLWPVVVGTPALSQFFMTEDGYLMLTIARNMAIGLGMSVSDGTIASNGVQPLATVLFTVPYLLTGGDKILGLIGVHLIAATIAVGGLYAVWALARFLLRDQDDNPLWPLFVASLWFIGPLLLGHTMNGLETGLYTAMIAGTLVLFSKVLSKGAGASLADRMVLGVACGVTFLARNDGAFLVASVFMVWGLHSLFVAREGLARALASLIPPGIISLIIASPWLINNYVNFGSVVPISGTAQALSGGFAKNAPLLPAMLFENTFPMFPLPAGIQENALVQIVCMVLVLGFLATFTIQIWRRGGPSRYVAVTYIIFAIILSLYYGFYYGAGWFLNRYLAPISPLMIIAAVSVMLMFSRWLSPEHHVGTASFIGILGLALCLGHLGQRLMTADNRHGRQGHFQVVNWVTENVPEETWVGAVQTGTLGYWHDRTINLDGKVNPKALQAILSEGNVLNYILDTPIEYLADWYGIHTWTTTGNLGNSAFSEAFDVIVQDPAANLAVLRRVQ